MIGKVTLTMVEHCRNDIDVSFFLLIGGQGCRGVNSTCRGSSDVCADMIIRTPRECQIKKCIHVRRGCGTI